MPEIRVEDQREDGRGVLVDQPAPGTVWLLRACRDDGTSSRGFRWPLTMGAEVVAPDWSPEPVCGGGLHGLLRGCGDASLLSGSLYLIIQADAATVVDLGGKVKVPRATVVMVGTRDACVARLAAVYPDTPVVYAHRSSGDRGTATAGDRGTATAGCYGTATAGDDGTATAGCYGTATAGDGGTATAGDGGTATAGDGGTATAGDGGTVCIWLWDGTRYRLCVGYVGEDGIEANRAYRVRDGRLVPVKP